MKYIILILAALLLSAILLPIGFIFHLFFRGRKEWLFKICLGIDQLGNVVCGKLFDLTLIKSNGYQFGFEDETISSVIGKNCEAGTLTIAGKLLNAFLNALWKNHTINSIENFKNPLTL